jgi:hypothetical protein
MTTLQEEELQQTLLQIQDPEQERGMDSLDWAQLGFTLENVIELEPNQDIPLVNEVLEAAMQHYPEKLQEMHQLMEPVSAAYLQRKYPEQLPQLQIMANS